MKHRFSKLAVALLVAGGAALTGYAATPGEQQAPAAKAASSAALTDGEVRKVDKDAKKLTIRHGPIRNLDMPAMTMVFQVKDPAMLDQVKAGDKIKFSVDRTMTVTSLEPAR